MPTFTAEITSIAAGDDLDLDPDDRVLVMGTTGGIGHVTRVTVLVLRARPKPPTKASKKDPA